MGIIQLIDRKTVYIMVMTWYYTFTVLYSLGIGFFDVLVPSLMITIISYAWLLRWTSKMDQAPVFDYLDVATNVFVYSFVGFYIGFLSIAFSSGYFELVRMMLIISQVVLWVSIWSDYYWQRVKDTI